jgi:hypothetical protein
LWVKGVNAKNVHKAMFPAYGGKCFPVNWYIPYHFGGKHFADNEEVETEVRKWLRQQSKDVTRFDAQRINIV